MRTLFARLSAAWPLRTPIEHVHAVTRDLALLALAIGLGLAAAPHPFTLPPLLTSLLLTIVVAWTARESEMAWITRQRT